MVIDESIHSPHQSSRGAHKPQLIVMHICDGTYEGTKAWFASPASQTSSHYIVAQDGRICECVPLDRMAWCNGTTTDRDDKRYFGNATVPLVRANGGNANQYSVSIEFEGYSAKTAGALTAAQMDAAVLLCRRIRDEVQDRYGNSIPFDRQHIVGHFEINPKTKPACPGPKFPWQTLIERLQAAQTPQVEGWYRVRVGAFRSRENADALAKELAEKGYPAMVVAPQ